MLKWARAHGCPWCERTCAWPMGSVTWRIVSKWAREHDCPWEENLDDLETDCCVLAIKGEHLELSKRLRENDCPWDEDTWRRWKC